MIKTNEFSLISKASTALLQMLIKFRDCKNELRERDNLMAPLCLTLLPRKAE